MPQGRTRRPRRRGQRCTACGADAWLKRADRKTWSCAPCTRSRARVRGQHRRRAGDMCSTAKQRARRAGVPFSITPADIEAVWPADGRCPVLGLRFQRGIAGRSRGTSPSLDRLNPAWGYEPGNIAVISLTANRIKNVGRAQDLERIAAWMREQGLD